MAALLSDDLETRCRMALRIQEVGEPELMQQILFELQAAVRSRSQADREKASTLLVFLGPRLFGFPPAPLSLEVLIERLRAPDPEVRAQAAKSLGDRGIEAEPALPALQAALTDTDTEAQFQVAMAIGAITGTIPPKPRTTASTEDRQSGSQEDCKRKAGDAGK